MGDETYVFSGEEVTEVWESMDGSYWVITGDQPAGKYGYAYLSAHPQFSEWGYINPDIIDERGVWQVPRKNWSYTGPDKINIERKSEA